MVVKSASREQSQYQSSEQHDSFKSRAIGHGDDDDARKTVKRHLLSRRPTWFIVFLFFGVGLFLLGGNHKLVIDDDYYYADDDYNYDNNSKIQNTVTDIATPKAKLTSRYQYVDDQQTASTVSSRCKQIYFWGGGKSGSTSLWSLLVKGGDWWNGTQSTPFVDGVAKESCFHKTKHIDAWTTLTQNNTLCISSAPDANKKNNLQFLLNGCPQHTQHAHAKMALEYAEMAEVDYYFLMLIRDPVDRLVSHINDEVRRGGKKFKVAQKVEAIVKRKSSFEFYVKTSLRVRLSAYGTALQNLLQVVKDPNKVLIIPMESLTNDPQEVLNNIMDHIEGRHWELSDMNVHANSGVKNKQNVTYQTLTDNIRDELRTMFRKDVLLLEQIIGKRFSWSSWAHENDENDEVETKELKHWLTSKPRSLQEAGLS